MRAAAYLRRSSADENNPGDVSHEAQLSTVRALATANGIDPDTLVLFEDWGKSADETKKAKRTRYLALLKAIEDQEFDFVFVYHVDRIIRSVADFSELTRIADGHTTVMAPGLTLTGSDPMARAFAQIAAVFAELELGRIKQRVQKGFGVRRARGDDLGSFRYGYRTARQADGSIKWERDESVPLDQVLEVVARNKGNILASCVELDTAGIPAPRGGKKWGTSALTRIVDREAPDLRPARNAAGKRQPTRSVLTGLVRCPACETWMTPIATRDALYCHNGRRGGHGKYFTKAGPILAMLHGLTDGQKVVHEWTGTANESDALDLDAARERWRRANVRFQAGGITDDEFADEAKTWKAAQDAAAKASRVSHFRWGEPLVRWSAEPERVNADLRQWFAEVRLDATTLAPVEAVRR